MATPDQLEQVAAAFSRRDYPAAAQLLKPLFQQYPNHPWVKLYMGRLQEVSGKASAAETAYRSLLRETSNPKIALQARQGLQRLDETAQAKRKQAIAQATADPTNTEIGVLVLEPLSSDDRQRLLSDFARIMKLDAYTARIHLSHRGWRLYRTGAIGELQVYGQELQAAGIPTFWLPIAQVTALRVFRVHYFQSVSQQPTVVCMNEAGQLGSLAFEWSEVSGCIEGLLPIFEDVVDLGPWNKLKRKEETQDYAQMLDLHLPQRQAILRFCDRTYQFQQGVDFNPRTDSSDRPNQSTTRINWNHMHRFLHTRLSAIDTHAQFTPFAETALEHLTMLKQFKPHIDIFRKEESPWDRAFHLYSGLVFRKVS